MKRVIALLLVLSVIFALAACSAPTTCDICGETKSCKTIEVLGQKMNICGDCEKEMNDLANSLADGLGDLF